MPHSPEIDEHPGDVLSVAVIGNDTVLAALPAHPVQLAHGCHLLGYHIVVPASWGDELIADAVLRDAEKRGRRPAIICACERARSRLTTGDGELIPFLISTIAPPVATARYLRALWAGSRLDITLVGDCASGADPVFDARYSPDYFLVRLRSAGIDLRELPIRFESRMPADRRRHASLPGGCPTPDALARCCPDRQLVELTDANLAIELAQHLFAQNAVLMDIAPGVGCSCTGVRDSGSARTARVAVTSLEPPRSSEPIVNSSLLADLSAPTVPRLKPAQLVPEHDNDLVESMPASASVPVGGDRDVTTMLRQHPIADLAPSSWEPAPNVSRLNRRPIAITPPYALRAISGGPRYVSAASQALRTSDSTPSISSAADDPSSAAIAAPPASDTVTHAMGVPEIKPAVDGASENARLNVELPHVEDRTAPARIPARRPHVPPQTRRGRWGNAVLWGTVLVAALLLAIAILARRL